MLLLALLACLNPDGDDSDPPDGCADLAPDGTFALPSAGTGTQIHLASAFDGEQLWLAWNEPAPSGAFQVFAGSIACDGSELVAPMRIDDAPENQIDPALAIRGDQVLVVWQSDNAVPPDNLDLRLRRLDRTTGQPLDDVRELTPTRAGAPFTGSLWMASVAATDEGYVLAGSAAIDGGFRVFTTELDPDGEPVGAMVEPLPDPSITQQAPIVAVDRAGSVHLVFDGEAAWYSRDGAAATELGAGSFPGVAPEGPIVGFSDGQIHVGPPEAPVEVGPQGGGVALASAGTGGFVGWLRNLSGLANELKVARFDASGNVGPRTDLGTSNAPPYGWNLTPITEDVVFVAWQEGTSPLFEGRGRFVRPE